MTAQEFNTLIQYPETVEAKHAADLRDLVQKYPSFYQARVLWLKALQLSDSLMLDAQLSRTVLYTRDNRWLYYYLYPEMKLSEEQNTGGRPARFSGSYFDMLDAAAAEGGDPGVSLRKIAEQLKSSRAMLSQQQKDNPQESPAIPPKAVVPVIDYFKYDDEPADLSLEERSRRLIRERKYPEAIEILKQLNLINPKKSIYFADQIRFLEKIIANSF